MEEKDEPLSSPSLHKVLSRHLGYLSPKSLLVFSKDLENDMSVCLNFLETCKAILFTPLKAAKREEKPKRDLLPLPAVS